MGVFSNFINSIKGRTVYIGGVGSRAPRRDIAIERQELCSAIIDCNATHIARAQVLHVTKDADGRIQNIKRTSEYTRLFNKPNKMMGRQEFLYAMAWQLQLANLSIAWVKWEGNHPTEIWPLAYLDAEIRQSTSGEYVIQLTDLDGRQLVVNMADCIVLRRKYNGAGYTGQDNSAIKTSLDMVTSLDEGMQQAVQISNKIHGLLKQKKALLAQDTIAQSQSDFIARMDKAAKEGGVVALDASEDYVPLNVQAWTANAAQQKQITDRIYTYWRTPVEVVNNTATEQVMQNYYDSVVEPVWEAMAEAFTSALFTRKEQAFGSSIVVTSGAATGASWNTKLMIVANTKDLGLLTPNEYRELLGYAPVEDGDERLVSLNYVKSGDQSNYQVGTEPEPTPADDNVDDGQQEGAQDE